MTPAQVAQLVQWLVIYATGCPLDKFGFLVRPDDGRLLTPVHTRIEGVSVRADDWLSGGEELYVFLDASIMRSGSVRQPYSRLIPGGPTRESGSFRFHNGRWQWMAEDSCDVCQQVKPLATRGDSAVQMCAPCSVDELEREALDDLEEVPAP